MMRELTGAELTVAGSRCLTLQHLDFLNAPCPTCRADVIRLVDGGSVMPNVRDLGTIEFADGMDDSPASLPVASGETITKEKPYRAGTWSNWIAPFHRCAYCGESLNWHQLCDVFDRPIISATCACGVVYSTRLSDEGLETARAVEAGNKLADDIKRALPLPSEPSADVEVAMRQLYNAIRDRGHATTCVTWAPENARTSEHCDCGYHAAMDAEAKIRLALTRPVETRGETPNKYRPVRLVDGVVRFAANPLVERLYRESLSRGFGLNELCDTGVGDVDAWRELAQLIGYSLSGYCELNYVCDDEAECAAVDALARAALPSPERADRNGR